MRTMRTDFTNLSIGRRGATRRTAFSLVELLVVIGIISLLIGIALPAFSQARIKTKVAATQAMLSTISTGIAVFQANEQYGGSLPPSAYLPGVISPHTNNPVTLGGASFLVWALAGADLQGTPGFRDLNGIDPLTSNPRLRGVAPWADDTGSANANGLYWINPATNKPHHSRGGDFANVTKMSLPKRQDNKFVLPVDAPQPQVMDSLCFLDSWGQPILYYRAYPGNSQMVNNSTTESALLTGEIGLGARGIYSYLDNINITGFPRSGKGLDFGAGNKHFEPLQSGDVLGNKQGPVGDPPPRGSFGYTVWNPSVTATYRPHNQESFILLSPGPDGRYGTPDDIANFPTNK